MGTVNTTINLGRTYLTRGVNDLVVENLTFAKFVTNSLKRHAQGDWGDLCRGDWQENERAHSEGERLFSVYKSEWQLPIWIITEADRSATTVLFPEEY